MINLLLGLLGLGGGVGIIFAVVYSTRQWGIEKEKREEFERQLEAENARAEIDDNIIKLGPLDRRRMLGRWSVPGVQADTSDTH